MPGLTGSRRWRSILLVVLAIGIFAGLRGLHGLAEPPQPVSIATDKLAVVGIAGHSELSAADEELLSSRTGDVQAGMISTRPRYVGDCAAAGWTTLGAGRRAAVGGLCNPVVTRGAVVDWSERLAAASARRGDAQLGTLAESVNGCVSAVGPGAALAAAAPDGVVASYQSAADFVAGGARTSCPVTLIDAGDLSSEVITTLAADPEVTLIVTGIGPPAGSNDPALQSIYRLGAPTSGWLTSASTRREGVVTLTDLTRTLIDFGAPGARAPLTVDGSPFAVAPNILTVATVNDLIAEVTALSDVAVTGYLILAVVGSLVGGSIVLLLILRRWRTAELIMTLPLVLLAAMMLAGSVPWQSSRAPGVVLGVTVLGWWLVLSGLTLLIGRRFGVPVAIAAAGLTTAAFTVDAALGAPMQVGSLLNSRPIFGLRWYGFGNVTFGAYAAAVLLVAGWVAHRCLARGSAGDPNRSVGSRRNALIAVAVLGFGAVVCEGWPSMGTDFGGVIALTPGVLWLLLKLSDLKITWPKLLAVGVLTVVVIGLISVVDWSRGADRRSHLGNFVQRVIDGDAVEVVTRKAVTSAETIFGPLGISVLLGIGVWVLIFRYAVPAMGQSFTTIGPTCGAILIVAALGMVLNDNGVGVWLPMTGAMVASLAWWLVSLRASAARLPVA